MNLKIHNVSLSIKGKLIVNDVSITVNPGEVVGLMGPNGAGKTTTFNLAVGNIKPDKGEILMNGKNIHEDYRYFKKGLSFSSNVWLCCNFFNKFSRHRQKDSRSIPKLILVLVFILPNPSPNKIVAPFKLPLLK